MLTLLGFPALVQRFAAAARASAGRTLDFTVGSTLRALNEANAAVALWLQWLILIVLRQTRLATSQGVECDTWGADFGYARLPAAASTGTVVLSRVTVGLAAFVPVGTTMKTADGTQSFAVVADATNAAWNGSTGYAVGSTVASVTLPVQAVVAGAAGNVLAGTISLLTSALPGIDTVINAAPFVSGLDAESDPAVKARFPLFVDSRSRGTKGAALYAVASYRQGLLATVVEGVGTYTVYVDDGSGAPSTALLAAVYAACDAVRPLGTTLFVLAPTSIVAAVSMSITTAAGYNHGIAIGQVAAAILAYIDTLGIGQALAYSRLAQLAYSVPGVTNAQSILLNGAMADLGGGASQVVRATVPGVVVS